MIKKWIPNKLIRRYVVLPIIIAIWAVGLVSILAKIYTWWSILATALFYGLGAYGIYDWLKTGIKK